MSPTNRNCNLFLEDHGVSVALPTCCHPGAKNLSLETIFDPLKYMKEVLKEMVGVYPQQPELETFKAQILMEMARVHPPDLEAVKAFILKEIVRVQQPELNMVRFQQPETLMVRVPPPELETVKAPIIKEKVSFIIFFCIIIFSSVIIVFSVFLVLSSTLFGSRRGSITRAYEEKLEFDAADSRSRRKYRV